MFVAISIAEALKTQVLLAAEMTTENNNNLYPDLLTEEELIKFLRIPSVSKANDYHNVISHLKRVHNLPCIHICRQPLYPTEAVRRWIGEKTVLEK